MILVTLGTQDNSFERLLKKIDECIQNKIITETVEVQAGKTTYESRNMEIYDFISQDEMKDKIKQANYIITHGGVGSIIGSLKENKKVIAVPRKKEYNEHVNNHQQQIVQNFNDEGYIIGIDNVQDLPNAINRIKNFVPKKYKSNTEKFIKIIEDFIEN